MIQKTLKALAILAVAGLWLAPSALAENSLKKHETALSFSIAEEGIDLSGRHFIGDDLAVLALFGFQVTSNDESRFDIGVGIRKYLLKADLAPFIGTDVAYLSSETPKGDTQSEFAVDVHFGAEYFFHKRVSAEAKMGIEASSVSDGEDQASFRTFISAAGLNFYFP